MSLRDGHVELAADHRHQPTVDALRELPGRRYDADSHSWHVPAQRAPLTAVAVLLHGYPGQVILDEHAAAAIDRCSPAWITHTDDELVVRGPYNPRRVDVLRAVPEATYHPEDHTWRLPVTRAGAAALLAALEDWRFAADETTLALLQRAATPTATTDARPAPAGDRPERKSPEPHWRHHTRGPIFDRHPDRREFVTGIGWCVRVRVDPTPDDPGPSARSRERHRPDRGA